MARTVKFGNGAVSGLKVNDADTALKAVRVGGHCFCQPPLKTATSASAAYGPMSDSFRKSESVRRIGLPLGTSNRGENWSVTACSSAARLLAT
jgi:hypothetical protein